MIVVLGGDVGAGKSTHQAILVSVLRKLGVKVQPARIKSYKFVSMLFLKVILYVLFGLKIREYLMKTGYNPLRIFLEDYNKDLIKKLMPLLLLLNLVDVVLYLFYLKIMLLLNYVLIIEDHIVGWFNALLYHLYFLRSNSHYKNSMSRSLLKITTVLYQSSLKSDNHVIIVFLYCDINELSSRWRSRGSPPESNEYLMLGRIGWQYVRRILKNYRRVKCIEVCTNDNVLNVAKRIIREVVPGCKKY